MVALMAASFIAVTLRGMASFGVSQIRHPLPLYLFPVCLSLGISGLVARRVDPICFAPRLAVTSVIAAIAIFIVKLGSFYVVPPGLEGANLTPLRAARRGPHAARPRTSSVRHPLPARRGQF
jgi:hypothetical protein